MPKKSVRRYIPIISLQQLVDRNAVQNKDKVLFRYFVEKDRVEEMTYFEFYRAVYALIDRFKELGLAGKKIAVTGDTCPEWLITYFAAIITGGVAIPLDKELKGSEIAGFLQIGGADAIVFTKSVSKQFEEFYQKADCVKYYLPVCYDEELYGGKQDVIDFNTLVVYDKEQQIDTDEILKDIIGLDDESIAKLKEKKVI